MKQTFIHCKNNFKCNKSLFEDFWKTYLGKVMERSFQDGEDGVGSEWIFVDS